ncbi:MAG: N-acetylmuramoyl-L-alanine amidase [Deltaproteobacteria bacterium]|nr:N-acetylmuramoyl-L-alanine amidase [Deltaproteobacteria bacterium]
MKNYKTLVAVQILLSFGILSSIAESKTKLLSRSSVEDAFVIEAIEGRIPQDPSATKQSLNFGVNLGGGERPRAEGVSKPEKEPSLEANSNEKRIRVVIDPGHGGKDIGAQGFFGVMEKEICLKVSKMIKRELERYSKMQGILLEIKLSREGDAFIPLRERAKLANVWGADLFVSVHANSSPASKAKGFEVYFLSPEATDEEASKLARLENQAPPTPVSAQIISILSDATKQYHVAESSQLAESMFSAVSRRINSNGRAVRQAPFTVLHGTNMPAVLVEIGYVTNYEEAKNLSNDRYLKSIANAISSGIVEYTQIKRK